VPTLLAGLSISVVVCMILGYTIERTAYRRLRNAPRLAPDHRHRRVLPAPDPRDDHLGPQLPHLPAAGVHHALEPIAGVFITPVQIVILVVSAVLMVALVLLVNKTRLGRAMRATAENHKVASLMGVDTNKIIAATFIIGSALAAWPGDVLVQLRHRPLRDGLHARPQGLHRGGAGRHRQPGRRCSAGWCWAWWNPSAPATSRT
jgi:branched-chain amino acid transport system permease protein